MKVTLIVLLLCCAGYLIAAQEETRDLVDDIEDGEDLEKKHRKKKKKHQQAGPCGGGGYGYGKSFGSQQYTYVSAPVMNYFFGCGPAPLPQYAPVQPYPVQNGIGHHNHGGHLGHGGYGGFGQGGQGYYGSQPYYPQPVYQQGYNQFPGQYRPFQGAVASAASGFGSALAGYFTRPRKTQKQINQILRPIYKLF